MKRLATTLVAAVITITLPGLGISIDVDRHKNDAPVHSQRIDWD